MYIFMSLYSSPFIMDMEKSHSFLTDRKNCKYCVHVLKYTDIVSKSIHFWYIWFLFANFHSRKLKAKIKNIAVQWLLLELPLNIVYCSPYLWRDYEVLDTLNTPFTQTLRCSLFSFLRYWSFNSDLPFKPLYQLYFCKGFFEIGSHKLFTWLTLNCDPPDLCLLSI
jgi:hypothetical protein